MGWFGESGDDDDSFITSAYCDRDEVQWLYFRRVTRGFSDLEKVECEFCGGDLFVNEKRGSFLTSSLTPEVIGWLKINGKILNLVLTESSCATHGDDLLIDILAHDFSGSISTVNLYQIVSNSAHEIRLALKSGLSSARLIKTRNVPTAKRNQQRGKPRLIKDDLSQSPLQLQRKLNPNELRSMKKFLKNPRADAYKWSTTKSLPDAFKNFEELRTTSRPPKTRALTLFESWTPLAKGSARTREKLTAKRAKARRSTRATRSTSSKRTGCRRGT